jgi:hypothetical protein
MAADRLLDGLDDGELEAAWRLARRYLDLGLMDEAEFADWSAAIFRRFGPFPGILLEPGPP